MAMLTKFSRLRYKKTTIFLLNHFAPTFQFTLLGNAWFHQESHNPLPCTTTKITYKRNKFLIFITGLLPHEKGWSV